MNRTSASLLFAAGVVALTLSACSGGSSGSSASGSPASASGTAFGGQQPIVGATVTLYAAGSSGAGSGVPLSPTAITDNSGHWNISFTCPADGTQILAVATGGNPGGGVNNAVALSAAIGPCGASGPVAPSVNINEVTTVASTYALAQFLDATGKMPGASATNATGLNNAVSTIANLADIVSGQAQTTLVAGASGTPPTSTINTLADILAACVNSSGAGSTECTTLFSNATPSGGTTPSTTLQAILDIAKNPGSNVAALYNLASSTSPFQPIYAAAPNDWTVGIQLKPKIGASQSVAIDAAGSIWAVGNGSTAGLVKLSVQGVPSSATPLGGGGISQPSNIAIDAGGDIWVSNTGGNGGKGSVAELSNAGSPLSPSTGFTAGAINGPGGLAIDSTGAVWVNNGGSSTLTRLLSDGSGSGSNYVTGAGGPVGIAIDGLAQDGIGNVWVAGSSSNKVSQILGNGSAASGSPYSGFQNPLGIAIDASGNVWVANKFGDFSSNGGYGEVIKLSKGADGYTAAAFAGGGLYAPSGVRGLAIDGAGKVWICNSTGDSGSGTNSVTVFNNDGTTVAGSPFSSGGLVSPYAAAIDASGNLWFVNGDNTLTEFVGAAVPVKTPLIGVVKLP